FGKEYKVHYIVAVATEPKYRKQGLMHQVIKVALDYLKNMNEPFCYLLPEDDDVMKTYSKIGFVDVCNFNVDKFSENKYDIYPVKNAEYLSLMKNEEMFLSKETDEYRAELAKKRVMFYIFQYPNSPIKSIENLRKKKIYICQEV
ncbi:MAG: GNAT family N-acetyltransferase, partial [Lachnospiraceae bacterium]|nr:GNAT family N-acetyltransferase [Lachnospiraceae bacterium]